MVVNRFTITDVDADEMSGNHSKVDKGSYGYEEALDLAGNGKYNILLLLACFLVITAMGIDIFGLGIIVAAATCDLQLTLQQIGILSSMPFAGIIVMSYPWGYLSDTRGRKLVLMAAMVSSFVSAALSSLAPTWQVLAALRFISSAMSSAAESATYALLGECCGAKVRARYMLLMTSALMLTPTLYYIWAYLIMKLDFSYPFVGLVLRPWRLLTLVMALPLGLGAAALCCFSESPKFLANVGRGGEAVEALTRMYRVNGGKGEFPVKEVYLEEGNKEEVGVFSLRSLWTQIAPLFQRPLLGRTLLLFYLTFVVYIANNSFAIILPTIFNVFFTSYASSGAGAGFCDLFAAAPPDNSTGLDDADVACKKSINDNTIWAGCAHGLSFFLLNALIAQCAGKRKLLTIVILVVAAAAAAGIDLTGEPLSGLVLFYVFLTTAMVFGVISSYFVTLYPTSYRGMVACLGMMVARLSAFSGTNIISSAMTEHCSAALYGASGLVLSPVFMSYPWGYLSDTQGRRKCLLLAMSIGFVASVVSALSPHWIVLAVLKFLSTSCCSCAQSATYALLGESSAARVRGRYMLVMTSVLMLSPAIYFVMGYLILSMEYSFDLGFISFVPWRLLTLALATPMGISALALNCFYESPKFLANAGREGEAVDVLGKMWKRNGGKDEYPVKKLILNEDSTAPAQKRSLLQSLWEQTAPLFRPPLLWRTLQLYYITAVLYSVNNSLLMWYPFMAEAYLAGAGGAAASGQAGGLCNMLLSSQASTTVQQVACSSKVDPVTALSSTAHSISFALVNVVMSRFATRMRLMLLALLTLAACCGVAVVVSTNNVVSFVSFLGIMATGLGTGIVFSYFVELYPTSYRGMAACLGVIMARASSLVAINIVGSHIMTSCHACFGAFTGYILSGLVLSYFLPADGKKNT